MSIYTLTISRLDRLMMKMRMMMIRRKKLKVVAVRSSTLFSLSVDDDLLMLLLIVVCLILILRVGAVAGAGGQGTIVNVKVGVVIGNNNHDNDNNNVNESGEQLQMQVQGKKRLIMSCINMSLSDFYASHPHFGTRLVLHVRDFHGSHDDDHHVLLAADAALDLVKNMQVAAIMGPDTSAEAQFVINIGDKAQVPIVSYSATSSFLSPSQNSYFVQATHKDSSQIQPLCALVQYFGWKEVVPIYPDNALFDSGGFIALLLDSLQQIGVHIPYRSIIPLSSNDDRLGFELFKLSSMQTRIFMVHMPPSLGSRFFLKVAQLGMMTEDYVWIVTTPMSDALSSLNPQVIRSMQGVLGIKTYIPKTRELENFTIRWKTKFQQDNPTILRPQMTVDGLWAYDATIALAKAVEQVGFGTNFTYLTSNNSANSSTDLSTFGVSPIGPQLLGEIRRVKFMGLSGEFSLPHGELQPSAFRLINVVGTGEKDIGYWKPSKGLIRELNTFNSNLGAIIWPGDQISVPKGWVASPNGNELQIGVPIKDGFTEFVKVTRNSTTNVTEVTGYCIDVFDAVMAKLPYSVSYKYIPYSDVEGKPTESYDNLIHQVYLKKYDAVVGDITIRSNRTTFVDFTLPYTESGVIMIAPMRDGSKKGAWLFVKPLTLDLWVTTFCFFIFIAFVIWALEHRINEDFRGPPKHQVGTSLYYSFSTMVFSQSFSVFNNSTRFVVIIWVFVLLILTQSYTANLASLLTVEQLEPAIKDVSELLRRRDSVGYQEGSYVKGMLKQMNFRDSQLKSFKSIDQLHELLIKGTRNGGIAAAFDEIPCMKLFLDKYCSKYTMVSPTYKTDGFGFVFPLGSPLLSDVSRAVLKVTEGEEMTTIENKWFKQQNNCPDSCSSFSSSSLSLDSFWGLFTIAGASALFALATSLASFVREHRHVWSDNSASVSTRIRAMLQIYDQKNLSSHTFRKSHQQASSSVGTSPNTPFPQSPSSYWHNSERGFNNFEDHSTAPSERMNPSFGRLENQEGVTDKPF